jgi:hypothetical protein
MYIKQVRTKSNAFSTVRYDSAGNILTPVRKKELKAQPKKTNKKTKGPKWIKIISQYSGLCCVCNNGILVKEEILWNKKNKKTKHLECSK